MRNKIISRVAAGTFGVCFAYALIRQPFAVMKDPDAIRDWEETTQIVIMGTPSAPSSPAETVPETLSTESFSDLQTEAQTDTQPPETEANELLKTENAAQDDAATDTSEEDDDEDDPDKQDPEEENTDGEQTPAQQETGGDVPTLSQFLSQLTCGGCRHRCLLINPRCMKGRAKAESATVQYYETYGE